ncbi:MAG TPA: chemotaxis protein CheX [Phycisphaerales bacterium]|nr:chemotaxis protein CheX [Phycisphaerales bacterium]
MDQNYILPFIKSTRNIFETMFQMSVEVSDPVVRKGDSPSHDVSGIIGMSGDTEGSVVLSFPMETARRIVTVFTGQEVGENLEDLSDAVGELVNMIAGGAKAQFAGQKVSISCPSVVIGSSHSVYGRKDAVCVTIPCACDCGEFNVEVSTRPAAKGVGTQGAPASRAA